MPENDHRSIEQVGIRYAAAVDERDYQALAACFTVDGVYAVSVGDQIGRLAIARFVQTAVDHLAGTQHLASNFLINQSGQTASMRSTFIATHIGAGEYANQLCIIGGVYKDNLVCLEGQWLFARREIQPVWVQGETAMLGVRTRAGS